MHSPIKKYFILSFLCIIAGSLVLLYTVVSHFLFAQDRVTFIIGIDPVTRQEVSRGAGYFLDKNTVITSAHVVSDDRYIYYGILPSSQGEQILSVRTRLPDRDIAILSPVGKYPLERIEFLLGTFIPREGETIYAALSRSGAIVMTRGTVKNPSAQIVAYSQRGEVRAFSGIIVPDIPFIPGDSGSPIFNRWGKLIDVVHVGE